MALILLFALIDFAAILAITIIHRPWMNYAFTHFSYYIILALTLTWALCLVNLAVEKKANLTLFFRTYWRGIAFSLALATLVFVSVPKYFRVLSDETNLLSVAKSMTYERQVRNITEGRWYYEMFWPTASSTEKRPFLFPFFTSLMHTFFGYRVANVFALNYVVLSITLFLLYLLIRFYLGELLAFASLILVVAQPVFSLSATSGSYELFNLLFILASLISLRFFLRNPNSQAFVVLVFNLVMLANVRYESGLFLLVTALVLCFSGYMRSSFFKPSLVLVPFLLLPLIWQRIIMLNEPDPNFSGSWLSALKFHYAWKNTVLFFKYILDCSGHWGYAGIVNAAGLLAVVYFLVFLLIGPQGLNKRQEKPVLLMTSVISIFVLFGIAIIYQGGINDHPMQGRLYLPILIVLSVLPIFFFAQIVKDHHKLSIPVFIGALIIFIYYHPMAVEDRLTNNLMIIREFRYVDDFLKKNADKNSLIICGRPGQIEVYNYGAISYTTANQEASTLLRQYKNHLFSSIYVIQSISYQTNSPLQDNIVDSRYSLETVSELQMLGSYYFRISWVRPPQ